MAADWQRNPTAQDIHLLRFLCAGFCSGIAAHLLFQAQCGVSGIFGEFDPCLYFAPGFVFGAGVLFSLGKSALTPWRIFGVLAAASVSYYIGVKMCIASDGDSLKAFVVGGFLGSLSLCLFLATWLCTARKELTYILLIAAGTSFGALFYYLLELEGIYSYFAFPLWQAAVASALSVGFHATEQPKPATAA